MLFPLMKMLGTCVVGFGAGGHKSQSGRCRRLERKERTPRSLARDLLKGILHLGARVYAVKLNFVEGHFHRVQQLLRC